MFLLLVSAHCVAQWSRVPEINNLVCMADSDQRNVCAIADGRGGVIAVWEDLRNPSSATDIYIQRIAPAGAILWSPSGVAVCRAPGLQRRPSAVPDGHGGAIIVWDDNRYGDADIYAQHVDSAGTPQWLPDGIPVCNAQWAQQYPQCVTDGNGGAIVVWQDERSTGYAVYGQRLSAAGAARWRDNGVVLSGTSLSSILPHAASDERGGAIVVWEDGRSPQNGGDVYAQRVNDAGMILWSQDGVPICTALNWQRGAQLVSDGTGGAIIAWQDSRSGALADVYAQSIDSSGSPRWIANGVGVCLLPEQQGAPEIITDGRGGAIISWRDDRFAYAPRVFAQRLNVLGIPLWQSGGIDVCPAAQSADKHRLVPDGNGGAILAWQDARSGVSNLNIYAQRIDSSGYQTCGNDGILVSGAFQNQHDVRLVPTISGGCIALWEDNRNSPSSADLYASSIFQCQLIPVELLSFDARVDGEDVVLRWSTTSERNNAGFEVCRSEDGMDWTVIAFARGAGESATARAYAYADHAAFTAAHADRLLYRLRQIDVDGAWHDSPVVAVTLRASASSLEIEAHPNPSRVVARVRVMLPFDGMFRLSLCDALGRRVTLLPAVSATRGMHEYPIDISEYCAGAYLLVAETSDGCATAPLHIAR